MKGMRIQPPSSQQGLSLLELLVALVLVVVLTTVAVPSFSALLEKTRQESTAERLKTHLALARIEAVSRREWITLCRTDDGEQCVSDAVSGTTQWQGVLMFIDTERDRMVSHTDKLLRVDRFASPLSVHWNRGDSLTYQADGSVTGFSNGTFRIRAGQSELEHRLVISMAGRVREEVE
ncbi:hypothetical protein LH51_14635 [Nitrincola sp. A-D6]|uniref:GspH/FimT family protein n=1 Tax=Nitrincola sp. A-D6 TaxID=1545442 RepID=UPI00051FF1A9|nr:GspH/FimT family protein [Nitrincola sp. A-D6]KGK41474.1 hypothetical protein LH51_14635 [Nitrincola sp. A-D6]